VTTNPVHGPQGADDEAPTGPVVRDRRRLDPETGELREQPQPATTPDPQQTAPQPAPADDQVLGDVTAAQTLADELRSDLQRLQAEYVNYRRRVDRDRDVAREAGVADVVDALLPVLDDIHYAREHGDLVEGPFAAIVDKFEGALGKFGFERYGAVGEPFDPAVHDALMHSHSAEVTETTVVQVLQPGYRVGERTLRPARVAVADPE
jgi:molecular chaperone GrpE